MSSEEDKSSVNVDLLEKDEEFKEFLADEWTENCEDDDIIKVCEDKWDDDNVEDDFSNQHRSEHAKQGIKMESWKHPRCGTDPLNKILRKIWQ